MSSSIIATLLGIIVAFFLEFSSIKFKTFFKFIFLLPLLIPPYIFTFSWMGFLGKRGMFIETIFPNFPIDIYNIYFVVFMLILSYFPLSLLLISWGMKSIDRNLIDSARLISLKKTITKIILPLLTPHIIINMFLIFVFAISEYIVPSFLRVNTFSGELFAQFSAFYDLEGALVYSALFLILSFALSFAIFLYFRDKKLYSVSSYFKNPVSFINLHGFKKFVVYTFLGMIFLFSFLIPFLVVILESEFKILDAIISSSKQVLNSLLISIVSSVIITLTGFFVYRILRGKNIFSIFSLPLSLSSPLIAISIINLYILTPAYGTVFMLLLAYMMKYLPISVLLFYVFGFQISTEIEEASKIYVKDFKRVFKIILPLSIGGIISSLFLLTIFIINEADISLMVSPPGFQTLSLKIETLMHYGNYSFVASLSLFLILLTLLLYIFYSWLVTRLW